MSAVYRAKDKMIKGKLVSGRWCVNLNATFAELDRAERLARSLTIMASWARAHRMTLSRAVCDLIEGALS
jgi:hypothetical protein